MEETQQNISTIINALQSYFDTVEQTGQFTLNQFMKFMEPKFAAAGYREIVKPNGRKTNILILNDSGVGDFISASGAIREIRRLYPEANITMTIYPTSLNLAEFCPYVDEIIINPRSKNGYSFPTYFSHNIKVLPQLLARHFDICFNFGRWQETFFLMYMCGANDRITYDFPDKQKDFMPLWGDVPVYLAVNLANHVLPRYKFGLNMADISFSLVDNLLLVPCTNRELEIWYSPYDLNVAKRLLQNIQGKIYALCMGGETLQKHYPPEMYAKIVEMIFAEEPDSNFVILGGGTQDLNSAEIFMKNLNSQYHKNILNLVNKLNYRQSGAVLKLCDMYIGNDTGTMHMAAVGKCPVLVPKCRAMDITSHHSDSVRIWRPYKVPSITVQPRHALPKCNDPNFYSHSGCKSLVPHCITQIKPETMFEGFKMLQRRIAENNLAPINIA